MLTENNLHEYQRDIVKLIVSKPEANIFAFTGAGKQQPLTSLVLTIDGYKTMGEIEVGDKLIHPRYGTSTVLQTHPQGIKEVYEITLSDGSMVECGLHHLWEITYSSKSKKSGVFKTALKTKVMSTKELLESNYTDYCVEQMVSPNKYDRNYRRLNIKSIKKTGRFVEQKCISVDREDGLYITDNYIVTHNTVSLLTSFKYLRQMGKTKSMLVFAPKIVCQLSWDSELVKWQHIYNENFKLVKMIGSAKQKQNALFSEADIYLTNYESIPWLVAQLQAYFIDAGYELPFDMVVFDESSKMKRTESKRFKTLKPLLKYFNRRVGLTASPASNGFLNVYGIAYITDLGRRLGESFDEFRSKFFWQDGYAWREYAGDVTKNFIMKALADNTIIIEQEGNLDMPKLINNEIRVVLPPRIMKGYLELEREFLLQMESGEQLEVFNEASLANKLLQYSNGIVYKYQDQERPETRYEVPIHKIKHEALAELVESLQGGQLFVVYAYQSEANKILADYPEARSLVGVDNDEAKYLQNEFNAGRLQMLITHPASSGYGINLQDSCNNIVFFGMNYNAEFIQQTIARVYRQGQKKNVICHWIIANDTRDDVLLKLFESKMLKQDELKDAITEYQKRIGLL